MTSHSEVANPRRDVIEFERRIGAPPETVFSYFTDPDRYRRWQGVDAELDPRPGGLFQVRMTGHAQMIARGEYLELDPPRRLSFSWGWEPTADLDAAQQSVAPGTSTVEVVLVPDGNGTLLRLRHSGLPTQDACRFHHWGWELTLDRLAGAARGDDLGPNPFLAF